MRIRLIAMQGMWPRREPRLLEDRQAQIARDTRLLSGAIQSYREPVTVEADVGLPGIGTQAIWRWRAGDEDYWFRFPDPVSVVRGPVAGDVWERVYWTGDSRFDGPRYTYTPIATQGGDEYPVNFYRLGVPNPRDRLSLEPLEAGVLDIEEIYREQPIRVVTSQTHNLEDGARVKFDITSDTPDAPSYDPTKSYVEGDRVIYENTIYEATEDIDRREDINFSEWEESFGFTSFYDDWSPNESYEEGDMVYYDQGDMFDTAVYKAKVDTRSARFSEQSDKWTLIETGQDVLNDLSEFLNDDDGFQITVVDLHEFTVDNTDAEAVSYTPFFSGRVSVHYDEGQDNARFYTYTYITELNEEGPPAAPTRTIVNPRQPVSITIPPVTTSTTANRVITGMRIYRTATGMQGAEFRFVDELDITATEYTDDKRADQLAELMPSTEWDPPPTALRGLDVLPAGIMVGFFDQQICASEPYRPHAWPVEYRLTLDYPIVAIGAFDTHIVAATQGRPYLITGNDPRSMQPRRLDVTQACVSARSMVSLGYAVIYASVDGLVMVDLNGARVVTAEYLAPEEWVDYAPETIHAYEYDGRYIGFYDHPDHGKGGFVFDPREPALGFQEIDFWAKAGYRDPRERSLYFLTEGNAIVQWDAGTALRPYLWRSKRFQFPYELNVSAAYIVADSYDNLTFRLYAGGVLQFSAAVTSARAFRLPAGYRARDCEVEVEGTDTVQEIVFGETPEELAA